MTLSPASSVRGGFPLRLTGATAATRYVGATASGAPASGTFAVGDFSIDQTGKVYVCSVAGSPGTWVEIGGGTQTYTTVVKAVTESVASSTVVQADDELFFLTANGSSYEFRAFIIFDEPANSGTPDFKWRFAPASGSEISFRQHVGVSLAFAAQTAAVLDAADVTNGADANKRSVLVQGGHTSFGNVNYGLMWAQNTSSVNAVRVLAGSYLQWRLVA